MPSPEEIETRFTYHSPATPGQVTAYREIRLMAKAMAHYINEFTPESREQSLAFTALEECVFWANAAVARRS